MTALNAAGPGSRLSAYVVATPFCDVGMHTYAQVRMSVILSSCVYITGKNLVMSKVAKIKRGCFIHIFRTALVE